MLIGWKSSLRTMNTDANNVKEILEQEIGKVFCEVLECAGVYKCNEEGLAAFMRFVDTL